jgi:hypothetical protein
MHYAQMATDFLGESITVEVPQFESWEEAVDVLGYDLALDRLNGRLAQDARQTPKGGFKAREDKGEDREDLIPEFASEVRGFMWSATRGGSRDGTGLTKAQKTDLGQKVAQIYATEGRDPTPDEMDRIREELGIA